MALSVLQAASNQATAATASTITVTTSPGSLLVIGCYQDNNTTSTLAITDSSGANTWVQAGGYVSTGTSRMAMFYVPNAAAVTSITATWSGGLSATIPAVMYEIANASLVNPLEATATSTGASATSLTSGALTTKNSDDILLYQVGGNVNVTAWTAGSNFAIQSGGAINSGRMGIQFRIVTAIQSAVTTSISWTGTSSDLDGIFAAFTAIPASVPLWAQLPTSGPSWAI